MFDVLETRLVKETAIVLWYCDRDFPDLVWAQCLHVGVMILCSFVTVWFKIFKNINLNEKKFCWQGVEGEELLKHIQMSVSCARLLIHKLQTIHVRIDFLPLIHFVAIIYSFYWFTT